MAENIYKPGVPMSDPMGYLSSEDLNKILNVCENYRDKVLFRLLTRTGRRVGEIVRCLKPQDIDWKNALINYTIEKRTVTKNRELLPIGKKTLRILKEYVDVKGIKDDEFIFKISRQRADRIFKKLCYKVGIFTVGNSKRNKPHIHMLRHSFAIIAAKRAKNPADMRKLQEQLAHSRMDTTMFYLKFNPQESRDLLNRMWEDEDE